ncbi:hypothetical protein JRQ81_012209 [Phrynocephalus forsythii]|uniref:Uncharacterized protein n=1 Tax=Phrynocephalus forsythii TaxID=171643 RepID=A0A9Q1APX8_9SAUR|nr:hypothetical protein JRQ81_012209 [Phrynocephalus forsythii]
MRAFLPVQNANAGVGEGRLGVVVEERTPPSCAFSNSFFSVCSFQEACQPGRSVHTRSVVLTGLCHLEWVTPHRRTIRKPRPLRSGAASWVCSPIPGTTGRRKEMEMYQGKAPDLHLGTALNQGVKVEEDSTGREPEEGALQSSHRKEFADGTSLATVCFAPPTGPKEQWDAQWQQFLKTMEAPSLKVGNSEGSCHCWTVLPTSEEACSVSRAQQREIVPQVPFGSSEEARGPPDRTPAERVAREETSDQAGVHKSVIKESAQFPEVKQAGSKPGQQQLLKDPKEEENYILIEEDEKTPAEAQHQTERPTETCRAFDEESAQFLEAEEAGSEPEEELVFQEIRQDGHCVLIGEDGKATVEELHPPEIVVELESSEGSFREAQRAGEISRAQHLNTPEKKKEKSSNSLRTYENRAKNKSFQTVLMPQQEPERWEPPTCRTFDEESAQFPEAKEAGSEPGQELMFQEITPDGHIVLIGEDGKATTEEQRRPEVVVELESPGPSFREARPGAELSRSQQLRNPEKRKEKSSGSLRTYEKRVKTKTFQTVLVQPPDPARWEPPTCRTFDEESAQFPDGKEAGSEPGQELMFQEITPDGHVVLIGEDGKVTGEEQQPADVAVKAEPSRPPFKEAQHRTLNEAETRKDKSSNSLRTYENRVKTKAFQAALMPPQDPGPWEPPMCRTASEQSAQFPEATQAGSEPGQELFCKEIKEEEEDYVLIGADGKVAVEETLLPKTATGVGPERQAGRGGQQVGKVTLHQKCNDLEKKRSSCSYSLKTNVKKIKTEVFETDPMLQQDLERSGALVPEATQTGSEPGQELFCKEIKEEEIYVLIAEDGQAYKEEQHQPDSFIEVELSRQLFGEDQCDDETCRQVWDQKVLAILCRLRLPVGTETEETGGLHSESCLGEYEEQDAPLFYHIVTDAVTRMTKKETEVAE